MRPKLGKGKNPESSHDSHQGSGAWEVNYTVCHTIRQTQLRRTSVAVEWSQLQLITTRTKLKNHFILIQLRSRILTLGDIIIRNHRGKNLHFHTPVPSSLPMQGRADLSWNYKQNHVLYVPPPSELDTMFYHNTDTMFYHNAMFYYNTN